MNIRQSLLLEYFLDNPAITTCTQLAEHFECSEKTIRKDIDALNSFFEYENLKSSIVRKPGSGVYFDITPSESERTRWLLTNNQLTINPRLRRLCEELVVLTCTPPRHHTISYLSANLYSNKKQVSADIREWKATLAQYRIDLEVANRISITGDEELIRWVIISVIYSLPAQAIKTYIEPHLLDDNWEGKFYQLCLHEIEDMSRVEFTGNAHMQILLFLKVMMSRIINGHHVTTRKSIRPLAPQFLKLKNLFEEHFSVEIDIAEMHLLQDICLCTAVQWNHATLKNYMVQSQAIDIVHDIVQKLATTFERTVADRYLQPLNILVDKALTRKACNLAVKNPLESNIKYDNMNRICLLSSALLKVESLTEANLYPSDYTRILLSLLEYSDQIDYLAQYKIALVVNYGIDLAMYGKYRIEKATPNVRVAKILNEHDLFDSTHEQASLHDIDLLVAFEPLNIDFPCITISTAVSEQDIEAILSTLPQWTLGYQKEANYIGKTLICDSTTDTLLMIYNDLVTHAYIDMNLEQFIRICKMLSFVKGRTLIFAYYGEEITSTNMFIYDLKSVFTIFGKDCEQIALLLISQSDKQSITPLTARFKNLLEEKCTLTIAPNEVALFDNFIE